MSRIKVKINFEKVEDKYELLSSGFNANDIYEAEYVGNGFYEIKALAFKREELIMADKEKGQCYGYIDKECVNCGRLRVELFENGDEICERCKFNQLTEEFEF
ncbi:hypothetical protein G6Z25_02010 [Clostridium perfringens]|uniref:hypothetical protein n=1 Tax=Clostridium perfringens TaxID=1502 RepID=UPI0013E33323|nr:hypothetical protein [Clostridium perfringens]NGS95693.1 hypothetical protein [Clostridium perfringens]